MGDEDVVALVLDHGSSVYKSGFAGRDAPRSIIPSVVGHERFGKCMLLKDKPKATYVGEQTESKRSHLSLNYPIKNGVVENWDDMETLWHHVFFDELRADPKEHPVLLTEAPRNPRSNREKMMEVLFEKFDTLATYVAHPGVLCHYSAGRTCGVAVVCGDVISITPLDEGHLRFNAVKRVNNMGGAALNDYLADLLMEKGFDFSSTSAEKELVRKIKEELCYVALDPEQELNTSMTTSSLHESYELPDGQVITLNEERFKVGEALFNPSVLGLETPSLPQLIFDSLEKCSIDRRKDHYGSVLLAGGTTTFPGFKQRLEKELWALICTSAPGIRHLNIHCAESFELKCAVWSGGSLLACLSSFQPLWIVRGEYDETGPTIGHRKCY